MVRAAWLFLTNRPIDCVPLPFALVGARSECAIYKCALSYLCRCKSASELSPSVLRRIINAGIFCEKEEERKKGEMDLSREYSNISMSEIIIA